eukprot:scaffold6626_cov88-Cylindrotheca_fusiformis.AAC.1
MRAASGSGTSNSAAKVARPPTVCKTSFVETYPRRVNNDNVEGRNGNSDSGILLVMVVMATSSCNFHFCVSVGTISWATYVLYQNKKDESKESIHKTDDTLEGSSHNNQQYKKPKQANRSNMSNRPTSTTPANAAVVNPYAKSRKRPRPEPATQKQQQQQQQNAKNTIRTLRTTNNVASQSNQESKKNNNGGNTASALIISASDKAGMEGIDRSQIDAIILRESGNSLYMQQQRKQDEK